MMRKFLKVVSIVLVGIGIWLAFFAEKTYRTFEVKIVIPVDYKGLVRICFDNLNGECIRIKEEKKVFYIPNDGTLRVRGKNPFLKLGVIVAEYADGRKIVNAFPYDDSKPSNAIMFRLVGGTNDGKQFWVVIGTEQDQHDAVMQLHDYESKGVSIK